MGRLMLNVLLSFAQFEREVTGERIRDKIAAAKKKGLWMGGVPPLGYDVVDRQLVVNQDEARVVRSIFAEMLTIGSPTIIAQRLADEGVTTKSWMTKAGVHRAGTRMEKKYLHKLLRNRIYLGKLSHKGTWYPAIHAAIIDQGLWDQVQSVLSIDGHKRGSETLTRRRTDALLRGILYDPSGDQPFPVERHRITNLMIERVDLVDGDEGQGIRIAWRELGWRALIAEFAGGTIGAEMVEVE